MMTEKQEIQKRSKTQIKYGAKAVQVIKGSWDKFNDSGTNECHSNPVPHVSRLCQHPVVTTVTLKNLYFVYCFY